MARATAVWTDEGKDYYYASLDGEHFLSFTRLPRSEEDWKFVARTFEGEGRTIPMRVAKRLLQMYGAKVTAA